MDAGKQPAEVQLDRHLSVMKEISAMWLEGLYDHLRALPHIIILKRVLQMLLKTRTSLLALIQMMIPVLTLISFVVHVSFKSHIIFVCRHFSKHYS